MQYDVVEHLCTQEKMAAYFEAWLEETNGDAAFITKALSDIDCTRSPQAADLASLSRYT